MVSFMKFVASILAICIVIAVSISLLVYFVISPNLEFINQNQGALMVIFSAVVAISTIFYVLLTERLVSETKEMREAQTEPRISISIRPRDEWINLIDLIIQNIGPGPAYNVKFEIEPDFEYRKNHLLSQTGFIKKGIKYLSPDQKIQTFLTNLVKDYQQKIGNPFNIKVTYENKSSREYKETFPIDFSMFDSLLQVGEPPLFKIAKSVEEINREIKLLSSGFHKLETVVYTKKDIEKNNKQFKRKKK